MIPSEHEERAPATWLVGGGEMGEFIRTKDWSQTPLGPLGTWPPGLRMAVNLMLASGLPSVLVWGPRRVLLYNDAIVRLSAQAGHPQMLGQDFREAWTLLWPEIGPLFDSALAGKPVFVENHPLFVYRRGFLEETFFSTSFGPFRDEWGHVAGVVSSGIETTATILNERRMRVLRDLALSLGTARTVEDVFTLATRALAAHPADLPFALFYQRESRRGPLRLVGSTGLEPGTVAAPLVISSEDDAPSPWPFADVRHGGPAVQADFLLEERFGPLRCEFYPEALRSAQVLALHPPGTDSPAAFLVAGLSPRLPVDEAYLGFLNQVALAVTGALGEIQSRLSEARAHSAAEVHVERLLQLLGQLPTAVAIFTGPEHVVEFMNPNFRALVNHRDVLGKPLHEAFPRLPMSTLRPKLDRVYQHGESFSGLEHPILFDRSGTGVREESFFNYTYQPFKHFDGRIGGVVASLLDVTDWVRSREQAEHRAALLEAVIQSIPDGICIADTTGFIQVNPFAREALGDERVQSLNFTQPADTDDFTRGNVLRQALQGESSTHVMHMQHALTGERLLVRSAAVPVRLRGQIVGAVSIHTDVTEHQRAAEERESLLASEQAARSEAERANRLKDEFLARISHELATPLLGTRLWLDLLQNDPARRDEAIAALRQSTQTQTSLVGDLLDTARALSGKLTVMLEACEPSEPVGEAVASLRSMAEQKGVTLEAWLGETPLIQADPDRLRQVVANLLLNAVKFTPPGGKVIVRLEEAEGGVRILVRDTGRGFPPRFSPLLFVPFRQEEEGTTRIHGGLGLGLAIARQLVELHGGQVSAESPGRDLGATFSVWLPRLEESALAEPEPDADTLGQRLAGIRLLLVEDDALTRSAVASVLEQHGAQVSAVDSAQAALDVLRTRPMDAMLCDIAMPREDGYSLIRKVRALASPVGQLAAAAFTAHMREEDRARSLAAGFQLHISKSVDAATLVTQVLALVRDVRRTG